MNNGSKKAGIDRRRFLAATGGSLLAAAVPGSSASGSAGESRGASDKPQTPERHEARKNMRKIPIGVFDPHWLGIALIWIAVLLTLVSMAYYLKMALPQINKRL